MHSRPFLLLRALLLLGLGGAAAVVRGTPELAVLFRDHAVLQRERPVPVWGRAEPGEAIAVIFRGQTVQTVTDSSGNWRASLAPLKASGEGADLVVTGRTTVTLHDVVVGDVWLCSGQSNMGRTVAQALNPDQEIAAAKFPLIRQIAVRNTRANLPARDVGTTGWIEASPENVRRFTAVGYFFAREIHQHTGVPIGIIHSSWGGTRIEAWMSAEALASDPSFAKIGEDWKRNNVVPYEERKTAFDAALAEWQKGEGTAKARSEDAAANYRREHKRPAAPVTPQQAPSVLFNGMIHPLVPYALRGIVWYQGESNAWAAQEYRSEFPALITAWRSHFENVDLPFFWVQLAGFETSHPWAELREAQTLAMQLPHTGQAVAIDLGEAQDIHPQNKQAVGHRLALIARALTYGEPIAYAGPMLQSAERVGRSWRVRLSHAEGLKSEGGGVRALELAGADQAFHPATARIEGDVLIVSSPEVTEPLAVRYAWKSMPDANLFNGAGLPAVPFRTDHW